MDGYKHTIYKMRSGSNCAEQTIPPVIDYDIFDMNRDVSKKLKRGIFGNKIISNIQ